MATQEQNTKEKISGLAQLLTEIIGADSLLTSSNIISRAQNTINNLIKEGLMTSEGTRYVIYLVTDGREARSKLLTHELDKQYKTAGFKNKRDAEQLVDALERKRPGDKFGYEQKSD